MARARAATSLSFTIGIAFATLVVAGGILAGPAVLDCSHQPSEFGACLRGTVVAGGLLPSESSSPGLLSSGGAARAPGWIEAVATEYASPTSGAAQLVAEPGRLDALGASPRPDVGAEIALADPGASLRAGGLVPLAATSGDTDLAPAITGSIDASGGGAIRTEPVGAASLEPPALPVPPEATGRVGTAHPGQGRASLAPQLVADLSPVPALTQVIEPVAPKAPPRLLPRPVAVPSALAQARPSPNPAPRRPQYDERYPDVIVLPPPNIGENSSIVTLKLR